MQDENRLQPEKPHATCGAKNKRGGICKSYPMANGRCRMHSGNAARGIAHYALKDGRYSKVLPVRLAAQFRESEKDPDLLVARKEIALVDSRLADLLSRVDTGECGELWKQAGKCMDDLRIARASRDNALLAEALNSLERIITDGAADYAAWKEIGIQLDRRQRFVESERKRLVEMQQMLSVEQANILIGALLDVIRKNVTDRTLLGRIQADIISIADRKAG